MSHLFDEILQNGVDTLASVGIESARLDARILAATVLNCTPNDILMQSKTVMRDGDYDLFQSFIKRRCAGEPVSRILGVREFWSLPFFLSPNTLDPRPDSETVVETVLNLVGVPESQSLSVLDIGTGTGCLLLALLNEYQLATGVGVDISGGAVEIAQANATELGLDARASFVVGDWLGSINGTFDVIVSNPPYIRESELPNLSAEVRVFDPQLALVGGADGLQAYRKILPESRRLLRPGGVLVVELGRGQEPGVNSIMRAEGLTRIESHHDL
ncbi:MAG: peptide chain release factor N(5)-glutamine methyltransferase, partial [Alphaproteobacteria bacterium]|nr:peptide chain release factor N(5)-glutamine methyltransferase [Alphaproteobacteria bacterium]